MQSSANSQYGAAICCQHCGRSFTRVPTLQAHLITDHGLPTRVCVERPGGRGLLGGQPVRNDAPREIPASQRAAAVAALKREGTPGMTCGLCGIKVVSYHVLKRHLASEHRESSLVCVARAYDNFILGRSEREPTPVVPAPDAAARAATPEATPATETDWSAEGAAGAAAAAAAAFEAFAPEESEKADAACEEPWRIVNFGDTGVKMRPGKTEAEKAAEIAERKAVIRAAEEAAYACPDEGPNRHYEAFEAGRTVAEMRSLWRDARGTPLFTHYREDDAPIALYTDHITNDEMIDAIKNGIPQSFAYFVRRLLDNPRNRLFYKRSPSYPLSDVHFGDGVWKICKDEHVYPRFVENAALTMRNFLAHLSQTRRFIAVFSGSSDYDILDHHMYIMCMVLHPNDLEADYARDMTRFYYNYVKAARNAVTEYSETEEEPWNAYPVRGGAGAATTST